MDTSKSMFIPFEILDSAPKTQNEETDKVRVAQFGGVGGSQGYSPGGSPLGSGRQGGGGFSWQTSNDPAFDVLLGKARQQDEDYEPDRCLETRLEQFHNPSVAEEDAMVYGPYGRPDGLSAEERRRLRLKQEVHRHTLNLQEAAKIARENSVDYIQKHFKDRPEHLRTREELLEARRKNKDEVLPPMTPIPGIAKNVPIQGVSMRGAENVLFDPSLVRVGSSTRITASTLRRVGAPVINRGTQTIFDNTNDDNESPTFEKDPRYQMRDIGNQIVIENGMNLNQKLDQEANMDFGGAPGPGEDVWMGFHPETAPSAQRMTINPLSESQVYDGGRDKSDKSNRRDFDTTANDTQSGQEAKLENSRDPLKRNREFIPFPIPKDPYSTVNKDDWEGGLTGKDPRGKEDAYPSKDNGSATLPRM